MKLRNKVLRRAQENRSANRGAPRRAKAGPTAAAAASPPLEQRASGATVDDEDADLLLALAAEQGVEEPSAQQQQQQQHHHHHHHQQQQQQQPAAAATAPAQPAPAAPAWDAAAARWLAANQLSPLLDLGALRRRLPTPGAAAATPHLVRLSSTAALELARTPLALDQGSPAAAALPSSAQWPSSAAAQLVSPASLPRMPLRPAARPSPAVQGAGQHPAPAMVRVALPPPPSGPLPTRSDILLYSHPALVPDLGLPAVVWGRPWPGARSAAALAAAAAAAPFLSVDDAAAPSPAAPAWALDAWAVDSRGGYQPSPPASHLSARTHYSPPPAEGGLTRDRSRRQRRQRAHDPSFHEWSDEEEGAAAAQEAAGTARGRGRRRRRDDTSSDDDMDFTWCARLLGLLGAGWDGCAAGCSSLRRAALLTAPNEHTPQCLRQRRLRQRRLSRQPLEQRQRAGGRQPLRVARRLPRRRRRRQRWRRRAVTQAQGAGRHRGAQGGGAGGAAAPD